MTLLKKLNYIDVNLRKYSKNFGNDLFKYIYPPWIFHFYYITIYKVHVNLINERQHKTQGFLGKISESHEINLSRGQ